VWAVPFHACPNLRPFAAFADAPGRTDRSNPKHDLAEHVPGSETFMHFRGIGERELRGDRNLILG
jgi:hypothetical protein